MYNNNDNNNKIINSICSTNIKIDYFVYHCRIIVWISFFQIIIYILSCLLSENLTVPNVDVLIFLGATYGPSVKYLPFTYFIITIFFILIELKLCAYLLKPKKQCNCLSQ